MGGQVWWLPVSDSTPFSGEGKLESTFGSVSDTLPHAFLSEELEHQLLYSPVEILSASRFIISWGFLHTESK